MFRKKCKNCQTKISKNFRFCPVCGFDLNNQNNQEGYGMLGRDDFLENEQAREKDELGDINNLFQGFNNLNTPMLGKMLSGAMKMLEKEMKGMNDLPSQNRFKKQDDPKMKRNFQLYINGKKVNLPDNPTFLGAQNIREQNAGNSKQIEKTMQLPTPNQSLIQKSSKLPRQEAKSSVKRIGNRVIYEIELPNIKSENQLLINKLEDSTEIRAYAKDKVYTKTLSIKLALLAYYLKKQKLFLEFQGK